MSRRALRRFNTNQGARLVTQREVLIAEFSIHRRERCDALEGDGRERAVRVNNLQRFDDAIFQGAPLGLEVAMQRSR